MKKVGKKYGINHVTQLGRRNFKLVVMGEEGRIGIGWQGGGKGLHQ